MGARARFRILGAALLFAAVWSGGSGCWDLRGVYVLGEESAWLEGCIRGPCLCPVAQSDDLQGTFELVELPTLQPGPWRLFQVRAVAWRLRRGERIVEIRGSGLYQTAAPALDQQRLVLDLTLDGDPIPQLDSGLVGGALTFPALVIEALTPETCFQQGVVLRAKPLVPF